MIENDWKTLTHDACNIRAKKYAGVSMSALFRHHCPGDSANLPNLGVHGLGLCPFRFNCLAKASKAGSDKWQKIVPKNRFQMVSTCFKIVPYISCASVKSGCAWIWGAFPRDCANAPQSGLCDCRTGRDSFQWEINPIWGKRVPAVPGNWGYACHCLSKKLDSYGLIQFLAQVKGSQDFLCSL